MLLKRSLYWLAPHATQFAFSSTNPTTHWHAMCGCSYERACAPHALHTVTLKSSENVLFKQLVYTCVSTCAKVPGAHAEHARPVIGVKLSLDLHVANSAVPSAENEWSWHSTHAEAFVSGW